MPSKNTVRYYDAPAFYHVYNRGAHKQPIFGDDKDREKFLSLLGRHLDAGDAMRDANGNEYAKYTVDVVAYCLMSNHFHLLLYQGDDIEAISKLMKSVTIAYTMYFNRKYKHQGTIFQGVFRASHIDDESYLLHMSRYIHMNPRSYLTYRWSSIAFYLGETAPVWVKSGRIEATTQAKYREFLREYEGRKAEIALLKDQLADQ